MGSCDYCGATILFGGVRSANHRFCDQKCAAGGALMTIAGQIPADVVQKQVWSLRQSNCPVCAGPGPVDVHTSHRVYSVLLMTSWRNQPRLSCRSCGVKAKLADTAFSLIAGWWGFPWGLIMTPVQVGRNVVGMVKSEASAPTAEMEKTVRTMLAARIAQGPTAPSSR
jgi:hypothetical protein